jgi:hypothetical protein
MSHGRKMMLALITVIFLSVMGVIIRSEWGIRLKTNWASELDQRDVHSFHPYTEGEVPRLKDLIQRRGFHDFVKKQPYVLGYSYDGTYLAVILYEKRAQSYRIEIVHTDVQRVEETLYAPVKESKSGEAKSKSEGDRDELLQVAQETLDMGYRIKVPVKPVNIRLNQSQQTEGPWAITPQYHGRQFQLWVNKENQRWLWFEQPLTSPEPLSSVWLSVSPSDKGKWTVILPYGKTEDKHTVVSTVDVRMLKENWSEKRLMKQASHWLKGKARIAWRGKLSPDGPHLLLAATGSDKEESRTLPSSDGVLYQADVDRFILMNTYGEVLFRGNEAGLVKKERVWVDPSIPAGPKVRYRLLLTQGLSKGGQPEQVLTVDQWLGKSRMVRSYQLRWNPKEELLHEVITSEK